MARPPHELLAAILEDLWDLRDMKAKPPAPTTILDVQKRLSADIQALLDAFHPALLRNKIDKITDGKPLPFGDADLVVAMEGAGPRSAVPALDDIFLRIGSSMIDAQEKLNESSLRYSRLAQEKYAGIVPPAQFLIPRVQAELKIGLSEARSKSVNFVFIKDTKTKNEYSESTISLEMVATPPPPGASAALSPMLLLQNRSAFLSEVEALAGVSDALEVGDGSKFGVVFALPAASLPKAAGEIYLAAYVVQEAGKAPLDPQWKNVVLVSVRRSATGLELYDQLFENHAAILKLPRNASALTVSLGDAVMQVVAAAHEWMASLGILASG